MATQSLSLNADYSPMRYSPSAHHCSGSCKGHVFKVIKEGVTDVALGVLDGARRVIRAFGQVRIDANTFCRALKLGAYAFSTVELAIGSPGIFTNLSNQLLLTDNINDIFQTFDPLNYFVSGKFKNDSLKDNIWNILGNTAILAASVGGIVLLAGELTLEGLSKISAATGGLSAFGGMVTQAMTILGPAVGAGIGVGFVFLGADAIRRIVQSDAREKKTKAWLDLAWCAVEVVSKIFVVTSVVVGSVNPIGLIVLGSIASVTGIVAFFYGVSARGKEKEQEMLLCPNSRGRV